MSASSMPKRASIQMADEPKTVDLTGMTKAQLLAFAKENGIEGVNGSMLKADILAIIEAEVN